MELNTRTIKEQTKINPQNKHLKMKDEGVEKIKTTASKKQSRFNIRVLHS